MLIKSIALYLLSSICHLFLKFKKSTLRIGFMFLKKNQQSILRRDSAKLVNAAASEQVVFGDSPQLFLFESYSLPVLV